LYQGKPERRKIGSYLTPGLEYPTISHFHRLNQLLNPRRATLYQEKPGRRKMEGYLTPGLENPAISHFHRLKQLSNPRRAAKNRGILPILVLFKL